MKERERKKLVRGSSEYMAKFSVKVFEVHFLLIVNVMCWILYFYEYISNSQLPNSQGTMLFGNCFYV